MLTVRGGRRRRLPAGISICARMQRVRNVGLNCWRLTRKGLSYAHGRHHRSVTIIALCDCRGTARFAVQYASERKLA